MTLAKFQNTIKGAGKIRLQELSTGNILHVPTPKSMTLDLGVEEVIQEGMNPLAKMVTMGSYQSAEKPTISVSFGHRQPEVLEMLFGRKFATAAITAPVIKELTIPLDGEVAAVTTGVEGFGIIVDEPSAKAAIKGTFGVSKPLTRVAWTSSGVVAADSWMLGAAGTMRFPTALAGETVTVITQEPVAAGLQLGDLAVGAYKLKAILVHSQDNSIVTFEADNVSPTIAGNSFDPMAADVPVKFRLDQSLGGCSTYKIKYTGTKVAC